MSVFRILVVDDSPSVSRFVELGEGANAVQVDAARDARAALMLAHANRPDLALVAAAFTTSVAGHELMSGLSSLSVPVALIAGSLDETGVAGETEAAAVTSDPIESWLGEADARLGFIKQKRHDRAADATKNC